MGNNIEGIVVAKSRKYSGYCVIIFDLYRKKFYRIISDRKDSYDGELNDFECLTKEKNTFDLFDVISFDVKSLNCDMDIFQKENLVLDANKNIKILRKTNKNELIQLYGEQNLNFHSEIFINKWGSMTPDEATKCPYSFMLARVFSLDFYIVPNQNGENTCKCSFKYNGIEYRDISVTISKTKEDDIRKYDKEHYPNGILGFSFGHPYNNKCFKYVCSFLGVLPYKKR